MRRALFVLITLLLLVGGSLTDAAAQRGADPEIGDAVTLVDADRAELATITIEEVVDPFEDSADRPGRGNHHVLVAVTVENTGEATLEFGPGALILHDADGFIFFAEAIDLGDEEPLETVELEPGDAASGAVGFVVADEATLAHVLLAPADGQLVLLATVAGSGGSREPSEPEPGGDGDCDGIDAWIDDTSGRLGRVDEIFADFDAIDPEDPALLDALTGWAEELAALAGDQRTADVPAAVEEVNELIATAFEAYGRGFELLAEGVETGDSELFDEAGQFFDSAGEGIDVAIEQVGQISEACGLG